ncbi:MAG TPA: type II toxin-antitoxin system VapC family toxin, partial [Cellulomonas sp.]|nr:type II toxin-antitoxin system VapC family toxin [Cellulomonas sp.]
MIYLDTSALTKLLIDEPESSALEEWLERRDGPWLTSALSEVELALALARHDLPVAHSEELLRGVARLELTAQVRTRATGLGTLRTLDALHVASALELDALAPGQVTVVTYDDRMSEGCRAAGLIV